MIDSVTVLHSLVKLDWDTFYTEASSLTSGLPFLEIQYPVAISLIYLTFVAHAFYMQRWESSSPMRKVNCRILFTMGLIHSCFSLFIFIVSTAVYVYGVAAEDSLCLITRENPSPKAHQWSLLHETKKVLILIFASKNVCLLQGSLSLKNLQIHQ